MYNNVVNDKYAGNIHCRLGSVRFIDFERLLYFTKVASNWLKKTGIFWNMNVKLLYIFKMHFIPVIKAEFSASLLQSSVSKDP